MIDRVKLDEIEDIIKLWKLDAKALGIPYRTKMKELIEAGIFYCFRDNGKIVAFCSYEVKKRTPRITIYAIFVHPDYRHRGYAMKFLNRIVRDCEYLLEIGYNLIAEAVDGSENNSFYDKLSDSYTLNYHKTVPPDRVYILNLDKIKSYNK